MTMGVVVVDVEGTQKLPCIINPVGHVPDNVDVEPVFVPGVQSVANPLAQADEDDVDALDCCCACEF